MFGILLFILALCLSVNGIKCDENATFTAEELDERSAKDGDYIGCFAQECLHFDYVVNITEYITPDSCTATCKEHGFPYVAIHNRTECTCSCEQTCMNKQLDDKSCGLPCRGDLTIFCGGYHGASVYAVRNSSTPSNTACDKGEEKDNSTSKDPPPTNHTLQDIFIYSALIGISFTVVIIVVIIRTRRRGTHRTSSPPHPRSENAPSERAINQDHRNTSRYEPAALPRTQPLPQPLSLTGNDSTSPLDSLSRRRVDSDTGSNLYFTLEADDGKDEARAGGIPDTEYQSEGTAEYAYVDLAERSTSFRREMAEKKRADDDDSKIDEDGMVVNDLYAMPHKTRRI